MSTLGYALGFGPLWIPDVPVPCQSDPDAWFPEAGRAATALELEVALLTAVAGLANGLAQANVHAADAILSQIDEILGVSE